MTTITTTTTTKTTTTTTTTTTHKNSKSISNDSYMFVDSAEEHLQLEHRLLAPWTS
jgi:hypothetical protein